MKMINPAFVALLGICCVFSAQALTHKYPCDELVYDALTQSGDQRIQLCKSKGQINYNFGSTNGKSALDVLIPVTHTLYYPGKESSFDLYRGKYAYTISDNKLVATQGEQVLAVHDLQPPMVDNLVKSLLPFGVPVDN